MRRNELLQAIEKAAREGTTELDLAGNELNELPPELGKLTRLKKLLLGKLDPQKGPIGNNLKALPPEIAQLQNLSELDLRANQLSSLPPEIAQLQNLSRLYLSANPLPIPPEILNKFDDPQTIINYYLQNRTEPSRPLNEAKVLLVGEAKVGKTSLVNRLIDNRFDKDERMTEGIKIRPWPMKANRQTVKLNVWDFGGARDYARHPPVFPHQAQSLFAGAECSPRRNSQSGGVLAQNHPQLWRQLPDYHCR